MISVERRVHGRADREGAVDDYGPWCGSSDGQEIVLCPGHDASEVINPGSTKVGKAASWSPLVIAVQAAFLGAAYRGRSRGRERSKVEAAHGTDDW